MIRQRDDRPLPRVLCPVQLGPSDQFGFNWLVAGLHSACLRWRHFGDRVMSRLKRVFKR